MTNHILHLQNLYSRFLTYTHLFPPYSQLTWPAINCHPALHGRWTCCLDCAAPSKGLQGSPYCETSISRVEDGSEVDLRLIFCITYLLPTKTNLVWITTSQWFWTKAAEGKWKIQAGPLLRIVCSTVPSSGLPFSHKIQAMTGRLARKIWTWQVKALTVN